MWTLYSKDPEHWIPISTIASFKRMREYVPHGSEWLLSALRSSTFLEVNSTGDKIRRTTEVKEPKDAFERSVYAKGFPEDEDATLQQRLEDFFNTYGATNSVRMRRDENKKFKTSVFAEFADFETVDKFLKADPNPTFEGKELLIMSKEEYCDMKIKEKGLTGKAAVHRRETIAKGRGFDAFKEMNSGGDKPKQHNEAILEYIGNRITIRRDFEGNGSVDPEDVPFVRGATLRFDGCGGDCTWSDIKDPLKEKFDGRPPYIKYSRGDDFGFVGFHKALTEEEISSVKDLVKKVNDKEVTWSLPSGLSFISICSACKLILQQRRTKRLSNLNVHKSPQRVPSSNSTKPPARAHMAEAVGAGVDVVAAVVVVVAAVVEEAVVAETVLETTRSPLLLQRALKRPTQKSVRRGSGASNPTVAYTQGREVPTPLLPWLGAKVRLKSRKLMESRKKSICIFIVVILCSVPTLRLFLADTS
jgi:hypothetical protein